MKVKNQTTNKQNKLGNISIICSEVEHDDKQLDIESQQQIEPNKNEPQVRYRVMPVVLLVFISIFQDLSEIILGYKTG